MVGLYTLTLSHFDIRLAILFMMPNLKSFRSAPWVLVTLLSLALGGVGCRRGGDPHTHSVRAEGPTYITFDLGLRSQADGTYSINQDATDQEDEVREVRILLFQQGAVQANLYYSKSNPAQNSLAYTESPSGATATFLIEKPGIYDMVVIANESLSFNNDVVTRLRSIATREQLNTLPRIRFFDPASMPIGGIDRPTLPSGLPRLLCPLTAEYHGVNMSVVATQANPHRVFLPTSTGKVELLRAVAKVELIIKDVVHKKGSGYEWIAPDTFGRILKIGGVALAKTYPLMPLNAYTPREVIPLPSTENPVGLLTGIAFPETPDAKFVVQKQQSKDWSIGGIQPLDYKIFFYIPETLIPEGHTPSEQPRLLFSYSNMEGDWWAPSKSTPIDTERDITNNNPKASDYLREVARLTSVPMKSYGAHSVYRNSCYRITVSFDANYSNSERP